MIAVSSTVIPLPVYEVGAGYGPKVYRKQYNKVHKPDGPVKLITVHNQNKALSEKKE